MHSGFSNLRSALPMNLKAHHPGFKVWAGAQADIDRIIAIWRECLATVRRARSCSARSRAWPTPCTRRWCTRFLTYDVKLDADCAAYCKAIMALPQMQEWIEAPRPSRRKW